MNASNPANLSHHGSPVLHLFHLGVNLSCHSLWYRKLPAIFDGGCALYHRWCHLYAVMRYLGAPNPTRQQWLGSAIVGLLLPALGNGTVCYVQQTVSSSVAALSIATAPIWMAVFPQFGGIKFRPKNGWGLRLVCLALCC